MFDRESARIVNVKKRNIWLRASAVVAMTCLLLNVLGCAGVQPATKADGDTGSSKETAKAEETFWPAKLFWAAVLCVVGQGIGSTKSESIKEKEDREKIEAAGRAYKNMMDSLGPKDKYSVNP